MSKHFPAEREGRARPQLATLKVIIVIQDKANQGGETHISAGHGTSLRLCRAGNVIKAALQSCMSGHSLMECNRCGFINQLRLSFTHAGFSIGILGFFLQVVTCEW